MDTVDKIAEPQIAQRAAEWFIAHRSGSLSREERAAFVAWLKASPEHVREYLATAGFSGELTEVARSLDADLDALVREARQEVDAAVVPLRGALQRGPADRAVTRRKRIVERRFLAASAAAVLLGVAAIASWIVRDGERFGLPRTYSTAHAEQSTWRLPDGSVLQLNSDSKVTVRFSNAERLIEVGRGQAYFQVMREPTRRFRVTAGNAEVVALGTEFDVYRRGDATVVTVVEGKVAVRRDGTGAIDVARSPSPDPTLELTAGEQARISKAFASARLIPADLRESTAWLHKQIVFEQQPLAAVAGEFNRYSRIPIEIEQADTGNLRISGVFNAYDTDSFIAFLRRLDGVTVEVSDQSIRVLSHPTHATGTLIVTK